MNCKNCGTHLNPNQKFCSNCGTKIPQIGEATQSNTQISSNVLKSEGDVCLWCGQSAGFREEEGRLDSKWGMTNHIVKLYICNKCGFVHQFMRGKTPFGFD